MRGLAAKPSLPIDALERDESVDGVLDECDAGDIAQKIAHKRVPVRDARKQKNKGQGE